MKGKLVVVVLVIVAVLSAAYVTGYLQRLIPFQEQLYFTAGFSATPVSGQNHTVQFNATVSGGVLPYRFVWEFGDGAVTTIANPAHTYADEGTFTVRLTVIDSTNISRNIEKSIVVT